jgi:nucleoside-diphosphate-sugar epimerase
MTTQLVLGAGPVGSRVAVRLADAGHRVRLVTRTGSGPAHEGIERLAVDAADTGAFVRAARQADVIYNCANPRYHRWARDWPPIAASLLAAAEASDAVLVSCSNLYVYGPVGRPISEVDPLRGNVKGQIRAQMWRDALGLHEAGRIRTAEARGSDYLGAGPNSLFGDALVPRLLAGKSLPLMGDLDARHTFTYVDDMAAALVVLGTDPRAWGRAWHVPSDVTCTQRQAVAALSAAAGVQVPRVRRLPWSLVRTMGLVVPFLRELRYTRYQWDADFVMDSTAAREQLGLTATPPDVVWRSVVADYAGAGAAARPTVRT